jgi:hypothetical protein
MCSDSAVSDEEFQSEAPSLLINKFTDATASLDGLPLFLYATIVLIGFSSLLLIFKAMPLTLILA